MKASRQLFLLLVLAATTPETTAQSGCTRSCEESSGDTCASDTIVGCEASCEANTCSDTVFVDSLVSCTVEEGSSSFVKACEDAYFNRSSVELFDSGCESCSFWFSQVSTNGPLGRYSSSQPTFGLCSCCDDTTGAGNCPEGVPSCTENTEEFCATQFQFRTCKDWGNPVCSNLNIPSVPAKTSAVTCSQGVETVLCNDSDCDGLDVSKCTALCFSGDCDSTVFTGSVVGCYHLGGYRKTCQDAAFDKSFVGLADTECGSCAFWFSAVSTNGPLGTSSYNAPIFPFCSCCDDVSGGQNCPEGVPSCDAQDFCQDEVHFKTCKDWGNPACADLDIPSVPPKTDISTCSEGVETYWCKDGDCENAEVTGCTTLCISGSCTGAMFYHSVVGCYKLYGYTESCRETKFEKTFVGLEETECRSCSFWFSAVTTDGPFSTFSSSAPLFSFCSCCDDSSGNDCPAGVPSCKSNPEEFCAMEVHSKTCKEWGNPICEDLEDSPSSLSLFNATTCSEGLETLWCRDEECAGLAASNCRTLCVDGSCNTAKFKNSDVGCYLYDGYTGPCTDASFERSAVIIHNNECRGCNFWFSAVTTNAEFGSFSSSAPTFGFCSCCDDGGAGFCPDSVPSCVEDPTGFCSSTHLGMSCKDWGNPFCVGVGILAAGDQNTTNLLFADATQQEQNITEPIPVCSLATGKTFAVCSSTDCAGLAAESCTVECYDEACTGVHLVNSSVACLGEDTCTESRFTRSQVDCATSDCEDSDFFSSSVACGSRGEESSLYASCAHVLIGRCSCCDGTDCPDGATSCQAEDFCSASSLGRTCKDWGHPLCEDVDVPSNPPIHPAETCSLGEEIYFCDEGDNGCLRLPASQCTVSCHGKVCHQADFEDSLVQCFDRAIPGWFEVFPGEGCVGASFTRSVAICQNSCVGATFKDSSVVCSGPSCTQTTFDECSCCDGDGCPSYNKRAPSCEGNLDAICNKMVDGESCACRGFPGCGDEYTSSCESTSAVAKVALKDIPMNKVKLPSPKSAAEVSETKKNSEVHEVNVETESAAGGLVRVGKVFVLILVMSFWWLEN